MRVDWVIACRYAEVNDGLATIVGAGMDTITAQSYPVPVSLTLVLRLAGLPDTSSHSLRLQVLDAEMQAVVDPLSTEFTLGDTGNLPAGWETFALVPTMVHFVAQTEGTYTLSVTVDSDNKTLPLRLIAAPSAA